LRELKQLTSISFLLLIAIQSLPFERVSVTSQEYQITSQLADEEITDQACRTQMNTYNTPHLFIGSILGSAQKINGVCYYEKLPINYSFDVTVPPPNNGSCI
jgi:hypothetical protein